MSSDYVLYDRQELHECVSVLFDNKEEVFEFEQDAAPPPLKGRLKTTLHFGNLLMLIGSSLKL